MGGAGWGVWMSASAHAQSSPLAAMSLPLPAAMCSCPMNPRDQVYAQNYSGEVAWVLAVIVGISNPWSYQVALEDSRLWHRHIDQLCYRVTDQHPSDKPPVAVAETVH